MPQTVLVLDSYIPRTTPSQDGSDLTGRALARHPHRSPPPIDREEALALAGLSHARVVAAGLDDDPLVEDDEVTPAPVKTYWPDAGRVEITKGVHKRPDIITRGLISVRNHLAEIRVMVNTTIEPVHPSHPPLDFFQMEGTVGSDEVDDEVGLEHDIEPPHPREIKRRQFKFRGRRPKNADRIYASQDCFI
jgi:hypothetical protein